MPQWQLALVNRGIYPPQNSTLALEYWISEGQLPEIEKPKLVYHVAHAKSDCSCFPKIEHKTRVVLHNYISKLQIAPRIENITKILWHEFFSQQNIHAAMKNLSLDCSSSYCCCTFDPGVQLSYFDLIWNGLFLIQETARLKLRSSYRQPTRTQGQSCLLKS